MAAGTHDCPWRIEAEELATKAALLERTNVEKDAQIATLTKRIHELEHKFALAQKTILGPKSERMPTPDEEAKKREGKKPARGGYTNPKHRKQNAEALAKVPAIPVHHRVPDEKRRCPSCGEEINPIGEGDVSYEWEWIPGRLERRKHVTEVGRCPCKQHYARGPAPARVAPGCLFGPAFIAKLVVDKCADAKPIYRVEKEMRRLGVPISRSTMNDLVLLAGDVLAPVWVCMRDEMRIDRHVQADETSVRVSTIEGRCFIWTFLSKVHIVYVFSSDRSGDTPNEVLGGTTGNLLVDGYTGYNIVTDVDGRDRSGCTSHARRKLFEALPYAPEAREALDFILEIFMVEREAQARGIVGTAEHLALRKTRSAPVLARLAEWCDKMRPLFEPGSPMADALRYLRNQWDRLIAFLDDPLIPLHNNASEAALRIIALFRKNSLFFGNERSARRFMVLFSIIATCERHDINPSVYIADVLMRIKNTPAEKLRDLVPHRWKETHGSAYVVDRVDPPAVAA